jgi:DNA-binding transcriptional ArsR family regulator
MSSNEIENVVFQALAHPIRRTIIRIVRSRSATYTELMSDLGIPAGKLNYHLEQLKGLIEKDEDYHYVLTPFGHKAAEHLNLIEQRASLEDEKYIKIAALSQKASLKPIVKTALVIGIAVTVFFLSLWGYLGYIAIAYGAPWIIYVIVPVLMAIGFSVLGLLVYALLKSPQWIKRFDQRHFGDW